MCGFAFKKLSFDLHFAISVYLLLTNFHSMVLVNDWKVLLSLQSVLVELSIGKYLRLAFTSVFELRAMIVIL